MILAAKHFWHVLLKEKVQEKLLQISEHLMDFLLHSMMNSTLNPGLTDDRIYARGMFHYSKEHTFHLNKSHLPHVGL